MVDVRHQLDVMAASMRLVAATALASGMTGSMAIALFIIGSRTEAIIIGGMATYTAVLVWFHMARHGAARSRLLVLTGQRNPTPPHQGPTP